MLCHVSFGPGISLKGDFLISKGDGPNQSKSPWSQLITFIHRPRRELGEWGRWWLLVWSYRHNGMNPCSASNHQGTMGRKAALLGKILPPSSRKVCSNAASMRTRLFLNKIKNLKLKLIFRLHETVNLTKAQDQVTCQGSLSKFLDFELRSLCHLLTHIPSNILG